MSDLPVFLFGCFVFGIVVSAVSLLVWGASKEPRAASRSSSLTSCAERRLDSRTASGIAAGSSAAASCSSVSRPWATTPRAREGPYYGNSTMPGQYRDCNNLPSETTR